VIPKEFLTMSATLPPTGSTGAATQAPIISASNITGAPASTVAGIGIVGALLTQLSANGLPTTSAGWFTFGITALSSLGAVFLRA
jgi:hypothetical protein